MAVDIALENIEEIIKKPIHKLKALDPACGSGVFLVSLFGRIAESLRRKENYSEKRRNIRWVRKLLPKLHQLYGIDISPSACHITCFSLYLALLEQLEPSDVEYLHEHSEKLPPLLANDSKGYKTIHRGNLFDPELSLKEKDFDIVIGNPPWVSRDKQKDEDFLNWREENPNILGPDKQIAHGFMWKVPEYLSDSGIGYLLLPTAVLLNDHTNKFQEEWFESVTVNRVINFSDLRFVLFAGPVHPCVAVRFCSLLPKPESVILYESPKTDIRSQQGGPVYIREEDTTNLHLKDILNAANKGIAPIIWKSHYWGSFRDQRLLSRLSGLPKLSDFAAEPDEGKRWIKGQGIQVNGGDENPVWWKRSTPYLDSNEKIDLVVCENDLPTAQDAEISCTTVHRPRNKKLFAGPKVLLSKGSRKAIYSSGTLLFRDTFTAITSGNSDDRLLRFLAVALGSDLIYYFLFHTNSNLGIYRPQVFPKEFLSIPFFLPQDASDPKRAQDIIEEVSSVIKNFEKRMKVRSWFGKEQKRQGEAKKIRKELEPLVREYYGINEYEAMLIEDTLQLAKESFHPRQSTTDIPTLASVSKEACQTYAKTLCEMLNNFGQGSGFKVNGEVIKGQPYSVVRVSLTETIRRNVPVSTANEELARIFKRMRPLLQHEQRWFVFCQNLKVFDGDDLYILKPMQMRFWSHTVALNDADEIAGAILDSRGEKNKWQ